MNQFHSHSQASEILIITPSAAANQILSTNPQIEILLLKFLREFYNPLQASRALTITSVTISSTILSRDFQHGIPIFTIADEFRDQL